MMNALLIVLSKVRCDLIAFAFQVKRFVGKISNQYNFQLLPKNFTFALVSR